MVSSKNKFLIVFLTTASWIQGMDDKKSLLEGAPQFSEDELKKLRFYGEYDLRLRGSGGYPRIADAEERRRLDNAIARLKLAANGAYDDFKKND
jgi:hypothetical protein